MGNYISRDEFAKYLADIQYGEAPTGRTGENIDYQNGVYAGLDMAYVALNRVPTADVVEVVRCKDCKHWTGINCGYCEVWEHYISNQDYFCGSGERRANNG